MSRQDMARSGLLYIVNNESCKENQSLERQILARDPTFALKVTET